MRIRIKDSVKGKVIIHQGQGKGKKVFDPEVETEDKFLEFYHNGFQNIFEVQDVKEEVNMRTEDKTKLEQIEEQVQRYIGK